MAHKVLRTEEEVRAHFSNTFKGKALDEVVRKFMSDEPLFPEKLRRAKERIAQMDPEVLDSILNRKK